MSSGKLNGQFGHGLHCMHTQLLDGNFAKEISRVLRPYAHVGRITEALIIAKRTHISSTHLFCSSSSIYEST
jgi:hypothetical protein